MLTKEMLANYTYLEQCIKETQTKIDKLEKHPPIVEYGKVYGSDVNFPYTVRSYTVAGYNGANADKWETKIQELQTKLQNDLDKLQELKLEIEEFIADMPTEKAFEKLIFTYLYTKGMSQTEVAMKLHIDQSRISRKVSDCIEHYNKSRIKSIEK